MTGEIMLNLLWPDPGLSPNARKHYREKAQLISVARQMARFQALGERDWWQLYISKDAPLEVKWIFYPPDKRHYDLDGIFSRCKAAQDGIFDALETNDNRVKRTVLEWGEVGQPGRVEVFIREMR
jgi:crossover junction endodeoxyribonuclease RusA